MGESGRDYVEYVAARMHQLRRLALALVGDAYRADDLVQETITRLYVHWRRASRADNLDGYVHTMLVRAFLDERRLRWAQVHLRAVPVESPPRTFGAGTGDVTDAIAVRTALSRLPPRQQAVLVLRFLVDLKVDEVADILGCSGGTVKSQTFHGLATMRRLLGPAEDLPARSREER